MADVHRARPYDRLEQDAGAGKWAVHGRHPLPLVDGRAGVRQALCSAAWFGPEPEAALDKQDAARFVE